MNAKIVIITVVALAVFLIIVGIYSMPRTVDNYVRPYAFINTVWVSENPDMWFRIQGPDETDNGTFGRLTAGGKEYNIEVSFPPGNGIYVIVTGNIVESVPDYLEHILFSGRCEFSTEKLMVSIDENKVLEPSVKQIVFIRKRVEDESVRDIADINSVAILEYSTKFEGIEVKDKKAYARFSVTLRNNGSADKRVMLKKEFKGAENNAVFAEDELKGMTENGEIEIYEVKAGSTITYPVAFISDYKGGDYSSLEEEANTIAVIDVTDE
jgi:hypothetical protein